MIATPLLSDADFLHAVEGAELPGDQFDHRAHLRLGWIYLRQGPAGEAAERMAATLRHFAVRHGASGKYHETLTRLWMRLVAAARARVPDAASFDALLAAHPALLERDLPLRYYSRERLFGDAARAALVEPDLRPLPGD